jgi:hypothetical protein
MPIRLLAKRQTGSNAKCRKAGESHPKPHQCDIKATTKPVDSQLIGTTKPPQSHPKATPKPPQSSYKAPTGLPKSQLKFSAAEGCSARSQAELHSVSTCGLLHRGRMSPGYRRLSLRGSCSSGSGKILPCTQPRVLPRHQLVF